MWYNSKVVKKGAVFMRFKEWAVKNWRIWYLSYVLLYLPWFFTIEKFITDNHPRLHIMHSAIDDLIPFCEYFIIPYFMWFVYIAVACIFMFFKATDTEYRRFAWSLIIGMSLCMVICMIFPNGVNMRPDSLDNDNICARLVLLLWSTDTSTNVFPSIHVYNSLVIHVALCRSELFTKKQRLKNVSLVTCIVICLSTMFLKQHSLLDVLGACVLMLVMYYFIYIPAEERKFSFRKA